MKLRVLVLVYKISDSHPGTYRSQGPQQPDIEEFRDCAYLINRGNHLVAGDDQGNEWGVHQDEVSAFRWEDQEAYDAKVAEQE